MPIKKSEITLILRAFGFLKCEFIMKNWREILAKGLLFNFRDAIHHRDTRFMVFHSKWSVIRKLKINILRDIKKGEKFEERMT